jgi:1-acyl-sn-glycerol-3-phosphate acyltransferase
MKKRFLQPLVLRVIYKGFLRWFLKMVVGVQFGDSRFLKQEPQFILIANHNSHLDALSLMASLPGKLLWKVRPVAAEDYFGRTKAKAALSNYFINTLLIRRTITRRPDARPVERMLNALDEGYSLLLFPEGTRNTADHMGKMRSGIAHLLVARPHIPYVPAYLTGMRKSLPKGEILVLPYKSSVNFGRPARAIGIDIDRIMQQINEDFEALRIRYRPDPCGENEDGDEICEQTK